MMFWMSIGQVRSGYGQGTVTPQKYVHNVSVVISLSCSFINPLTYTVNSPDGLLWNNITPLYNVHVFMRVFYMFFYDFSYIFYVQNCTRSRFFITFRTFHVFKIEKLLGFGRFIFTILRNKNISPVSMTYRKSNWARSWWCQKHYS